MAQTPQTVTVSLRELSDFDYRMAAARRVAGYEIGDPDWADVILAAFISPEQVDDDGEMPR